MHQVLEFSASNFRSIDSMNIQLSRITPLVGRNSVGKSNVLRAMEWAIRGPVLLEQDFRDAERPVRVDVTLDGINESLLAQLPSNQRRQMESCLLDKQLRFRRTQPRPGCR
jgi:predicted ATP-dependent endonuclease of OLD family